MLYFHYYIWIANHSYVSLLKIVIEVHLKWFPDLASYFHEHQSFCVLYLRQFSYNVNISGYYLHVLLLPLIVVNLADIH